MSIHVPNATFTKSNDLSLENPLQVRKLENPKQIFQCVTLISLQNNLYIWVVYKNDLSHIK